MKLTEEEQEKLDYFIINYKNLNKKIDNVLDKIDKLSFEKDTLLTTLIELRQEDKKFTETLNKKYGECELNLETMELEKK